MKKFLLGAVAAFAIAAPGVAAAQSGTVDLGYTSTDAGGNDIDTWALGGAYVWGGDGTVGFQVDGTLGAHEYDSGGDVDTYNIGGHAFVRNSNHMVGALVNFGSADFGPFDYQYWTIGAEGAYYWSRTTLDGVLAYSDSDDLNTNLTSLDVGLTHFVTDNFSIGGGVGIGEIDGGSDFTSFDLGAEYQFSSVPISLYGGWGTTDYDGFEADALTIGARYNFGGLSLLQRDRSGASLNRNAGFGRLGGIL